MLLLLFSDVITLAIVDHVFIIIEWSTTPTSLVALGILTEFVVTLSWLAMVAGVMVLVVYFRIVFLTSISIIFDVTSSELLV